MQKKKKKQKAQPSIKKKNNNNNKKKRQRWLRCSQKQRPRPRPVRFFFFFKKGIINKGRRVHIAGLNGHLCPKSFTQFSLEFSFQIGKIVFWWVRRENSLVPPKFPLPFNQTPLPTIFSLIFFHFFFHPPYFTSN